MFLDFTLPEQVKYVCVFTQIKKKVIVNAYVLKMRPTSIRMVLKNLDLGCVSTKTWERARVSS